MYRFTVATEGSEVIPGTYLSPNSLRTPSIDVPVVTFTERGVVPIGVARNFERDEITGHISFDITLDTDKSYPEFGAFFSHVTSHTEGGQTIIDGANVHGVYPK